MSDNGEAPAFVLPSTVDATMLAAFRTCPQQFAFAHGLGLRPQAAGRSVDLVAGGAFAAARERLYVATYEEGLHRSVGLQAARLAFDMEWADFEPEPKARPSPKTRAATWNALESYAAWTNPPHDRVAPLAANGKSAFEWSFAIPLTEATTGIAAWPLHPDTGAPFVYAGRLDQLGSLEGMPVILDDKTTSQFRSTWAPSLSLRAQMIGYCFAVQTLVDPKCDTLIARQTAIRATGPEHREHLVQYSPHLVRRWLETTRATLVAIKQAAALGLFAPVLGDACVAWSRVCEFAPLCLSHDPESRYSDYKVERWSPLAREAALAAAAEG